MSPDAGSSHEPMSPTSSAIREDDLDAVAANVKVLIEQELDVQHRLGGHPALVEDCALCRFRIAF